VNTGNTENNLQLENSIKSNKSQLSTSYNNLFPRSNVLNKVNHKIETQSNAVLFFLTRHYVHVTGHKKLVTYYE
jgi:hypothetical protein